MIDGRLLQTDKKYSQLKLKQKEKIYTWMYEEAKRYHDRNGKCPEKKDEEAAVVSAVYDRIEKTDIWIPYSEVFRHYRSIKVKLYKRIRREATTVEGKQNPNTQTNE